MLASQIERLPPAAYLALERQAHIRSEYHDGQLVAMAGASRDHNRIVTNITSALAGQLGERNCNNYASDLKVRAQDGKRYLYPDIVVTCGPEQFEDDAQDVLLNPLVIIEVLSPSTEAYDRGAKFLYYQTIESLQEYALVAQEARRLEIYRRQASGAWLYQLYAETAAVVPIAAIDCAISMTAVYHKLSNDK